MNDLKIISDYVTQDFKTMKICKIIFLLPTLFATFIAISSCGNKLKNSAQQGKEYTSAYVCPMYCEGSGSDEAGKCPVCGMDYVKNENHETDSHQNDNHEVHKH